MNLIIKEHGEGKTTQLIYTSEATQYPILVYDNFRKNQLIDQANKLDCYIPEPLVFDQIKLPLSNFDNILIDDGQQIIERTLRSYLGTNVLTVTLTDEIKDKYEQKYEEKITKDNLSE